MLAIKTKFLGPTNYRGARVVATSDRGRIVVNWDYEIGSSENHVQASKALADHIEKCMNDGIQGRTRLEYVGTGSIKDLDVHLYQITWAEQSAA